MAAGTDGRGAGGAAGDQRVVRSVIASAEEPLSRPACGVSRPDVIVIESAPNPTPGWRWRCWRRAPQRGEVLKPDRCRAERPRELPIESQRNVVRTAEIDARRAIARPTFDRGALAGGVGVAVRDEVRNDRRRAARVGDDEPQRHAVGAAAIERVMRVQVRVADLHRRISGPAGRIAHVEIQADGVGRTPARFVKSTSRNTPFHSRLRPSSDVDMLCTSMPARLMGIDRPLRLRSCGVAIGAVDVFEVAGEHARVGKGGTARGRAVGARHSGGEQDDTQLTHEKWSGSRQILELAIIVESRRPPALSCNAPEKR